jgi:hypothetical protein
MRSTRDILNEQRANPPRPTAWQELQERIAAEDPPRKRIPQSCLPGGAAVSQPGVLTIAMIRADIAMRRGEITREQAKVIIEQADYDLGRTQLCPL